MRTLYKILGLAIFGGGFVFALAFIAENHQKLMKKVVASVTTTKKIKTTEVKVLEQILAEDDAHIRGEAFADGTSGAEQKKTKEIILDGSNGVDPQAVEKVMSLAIPDSVRQEILRRYRKSGVMPSVIELENRAPAAQPSSNE